MIWWDVMWYDMIRCDIVWYNVIWWDMMWYDVVLVWGVVEVEVIYADMSLRPFRPPFWSPSLHAHHTNTRTALSLPISLNTHKNTTKKTRTHCPSPPLPTHPLTLIRCVSSSNTYSSKSSNVFSYDRKLNGISWWNDGIRWNNTRKRCIVSGKGIFISCRM